MSSKRDACLERSCNEIESSWNVCLGPARSDPALIMGRTAMTLQRGPEVTDIPQAHQLELRW